MVHNDKEILPYGTHLPVLDFLFNKFGIASTLEFGVGYYSTEFFLKQRIQLTSIETDEQWIRRLNLLPNPRHRIIIHPNNNVEEVLDGECRKEEFDLALVDGPRESRWSCVNKLIGRANIIVAHDTENQSYNWDRISLNSNYIRLDYSVLTPWTSIYTAEKSVISFIVNELLQAH